MNAKVKFHLIASTLNFSVFCLAAYLNYQIGALWDEKFGIRASDVLTFITNLQGYLFFWLFTFSIYLFKNPKQHFLIFLGLLTLMVFFYQNYLIFARTELYTRGSDFVFQSYLLAFYDTLPFVLIVGLGTHYSQLILGNKILSEYYK